MGEWILAYGVVGVFALILWVFSRYAARVDGISYDEIDGGMREPYGYTFLMIWSGHQKDID